MMKLMCLALAAAVSAGALAGTTVWPHKMNPRLHPDDGRRTHLPPGPETLGEKTHFTMPFRDLGGKNWREGLDESCRANLGDFVWSHNNVLSRPDLDVRLAEMKRRGLYLFDLWGYIPGHADWSNWKQTLVAPEVHRQIEAALGDHWIGVDNGEQDSRWVTYADQAQPYGSDRFRRYLQFRRHFERMTCDLGDGKMAALVGLMYGHYFLKENNYAMLGAETAQCYQNAQLFYSAIRGAGKQYGVPWFGNVSMFGRGDRCKGYPRNPGKPNVESGPWGGPSLALMKKLMYAQLFYNCPVLGFEGGQMRSDGLTPIGQIQRDLMDWLDRYGDPGTQVAPIAVMTDFYAGWTVPRFPFTSLHYCVWGQTAYNEGDFFTDLVFNKLYPGYEASATRDDEGGYSAPTPYGDGADFLLSDAPAWLLARYPLLVVAGKVTPGEEIRDTLLDYVRGGGHLVLPRGNAEALFPAGVPAGRVTVIPGAAWGYDATSVAGVPRRQGMVYPRPYRLTPEADRALDAAFRETQIVSVSPCADGGDLAYVLCRRPAEGDYTLLVSNNAWEERPLAIAARLGKLGAVEELPFGTSERTADGCVPLCVWTNGTFRFGRDSAETIAAGATRAFRLKIDGEGAIRVLAREPLPACPKGRALSLRGAEPVDEQLSARPTFPRHIDGVFVDARRMLARDDESLADDRRYCARQHLRISVDASDMCNHFPELRFVEHNTNETARTQRTLRKLFAKMDALGAKELVIAIPQMRKVPKPLTADDALVAMLSKIAHMAEAHGVTVLVRPSSIRYRPEYRRTVGENVRLAGAANLIMARELANELDACRNLSLAETKQRAAAEIARSRDALWLLAASKRDINRARVSTSETLASQEGEMAEKVRIWCDELKRAGVRVAFDALYPDTDAEYRDFRLFE